MYKVGIFLAMLLLNSLVFKKAAALEKPVAQWYYEDSIKCRSKAFPFIVAGATVMLIGDSLAAGMESKFISLAHKDKYVPVTHTVSGTSIFQWIKWIKSDLEKKRPALVVISLGTNDAVIYDNVKNHAYLYKNFIKTIADSGAILVWLGPPNISQKRIPRIADERALIKKYTSYYFESEAIEKPLGGDGIHSSPTGYSRWMTAAWNWMIDQNILTKSDN